MDKFNDAANDILKKIHESTLVYSSDGQEEGESFGADDEVFGAEEEDQETQADPVIGRDTMNTLQVANKVVQPPGAPANPQQKGAQMGLNTAYLNLMKGLSTKLNGISSNLNKK